MDDHGYERDEAARMSRRGALRFAGLTAVGAGAVALGAMPAHAAPAQGAGVNSIGMSPRETVAALAISWTNARTVFLYFRNKFHHDEQKPLPQAKRISAGIVGNLIQESGVNPTINQGGGGAGRGIAQWGIGGRWDTTSGDNVVWYAGKTSRSRWALGLQQEFILWELHHKGYGYHDLMQAGTVHTATKVFCNQFEKPGDPQLDKRIAYGLQVYEKYKNLA